MNSIPKLGKYIEIIRVYASNQQFVLFFYVCVDYGPIRV